MIGAGEPLAQLPQHILAVHVGQAQVENHQVGRLLRRLLERFVAGGGFVQPVARAGERCAEKLPDRQLVFDQQHQRRLSRSWITHSRESRTLRPGFSAAARRRARRCETRRRLRERFAAEIAPPWASTIARQIARPRPTPRRPSGAIDEPRKNLSKTCRFAARRQARAVVGHANLGRLADDRCRDLDRAVRRPCIAPRSPADSRTPAPAAQPSTSSSGKSLGIVDAHVVSLQLAFHRRQRQADDFLEHVPLPVERDRPGIEPGHVEQVVDEPGQPLRFVDDGLQQLALAARRTLRAGSTPRRRSSPAACAGRATRSSAASCAAARLRRAAATGGRRAPIRRARATGRSGWRRFPAGAAARDRGSGPRRAAARRGRRPFAASRPAARTGPWRWAACRCRRRRFCRCCVTHWATTALIGCWATDVVLADSAATSRPSARAR